MIKSFKNKFCSFYAEIKQNFSTFVIILLMLLISDDSYWFGTSGISTLTNICFVFVALLPIYLYFFYHKRNSFQKGNYVVIGTFVFILFNLSGFLNGKFIGGSTVASFLAISGCIVADRLKFADFVKSFTNVVILYTLYSLTIYLLVLIGLLSSYVIENVGGSIVNTSCGCIFFFKEFFIRNSCIFREPGMFMIFLNMSFLLDVVFSNKISYVRIVIYTLGVLSTFSTGGIIAFVLIYFIFFLKSKGGLNKVFIGGIACIAIYYLLDSDEFIDLVFGKLSEGTENDSTLNRWATTIVPIQIALDNPLYGCGFENYRDLFIKMSFQTIGIRIEEAGATNTITSSSAIWGIWIGIFWVLALWKFSKKIAFSWFSKILIFIVLVILFSNELRFFSAISYILAFYGLGNAKLIKKN